MGFISGLTKFFGGVGSGLSGAVNFLNPIAGLAGAGFGIASYFQNQRNFERQWDREDNSVLRRVQDLKNAGMNPVLAAGQGAQSSSPIRLERPNLDMNMDKIMAMIQMKQNIAQSNEQMQLTRLQQERTKAETEAIRQQNRFNDLANPSRLSQLALGIQQGNQALTNSQLDAEIKRLGISTGEIRKVGENIKNNMLREGYGLQQLETMAKTIAIEMARTKADEASWNYNWYRTYQLPTNSGFNDTMRTGSILSSLMNDLKAKSQRR